CGGPDGCVSAGILRRSCRGPAPATSGLFRSYRRRDAVDRRLCESRRDRRDIALCRRSRAAPGDASERPHRHCAVKRSRKLGPRWVALAGMLIWLVAIGDCHAQVRPASEAKPLETNLELQPPGEPSRRVTLTQALRILKIPSVSLVTISEDRIDW